MTGESPKTREDELNRRNERLALLSEAASDLLSAQDSVEAIRSLFVKIQGRVGLDGYFNFMADENGAHLYLDSTLGVPDEIAQRLSKLEFGEGVSGHVAKTRQSMVADHVQTSDDPRLELVKSLGIRAYACYPLVAGGRLLGTFSFASRTQDSFDDVDLEFMRTISAFVALVKERLRADQALRESTERLQSLVDSATDFAIIGLSPARIVTFWNDGAQRLLGYSESDILGKSGDIIFTPEDQAANQPAVEMETARNLGRAANERWHVRKDGTRFWGSGLMSPICDETGNVKGFAKIFRDLTQEKLAEEALKASEERYRALSQSLDEIVRERTAELLHANEQLQGFTYSVAHDLRQQIRGISGNASMLLEDAADKLHDDDAEHLQSLINASRQLSRLVDDLLAYAKLANQEPKRALMDFSKMANEIAQYVAAREHCSEKTRFEIAPSITAVADPMMLRMVLENLLDNACKYAVGVEQPVVRVDKDERGFYVSDNGIGLDMNYAHKAFEPFERLHRGSDIPGTGIGLANVKRIVQKHGGSVWVESEPKKGATFYFTLSSSPSG